MDKTILEHDDRENSIEISPFREGDIVSNLAILARLKPRKNV